VIAEVGVVELVRRGTCGRRRVGRQRVDFGVGGDADRELVAADLAHELDQLDRVAEVARVCFGSSRGGSPRSARMFSTPASR
jgi:hypothetical protein